MHIIYKCLYSKIYQLNPFAGILIFNEIELSLSTV